MRPRGELGYGDVWTYVAIEADSKLIPAWMLGERSPEHAAFPLTICATGWRIGST